MHGVPLTSIVMPPSATGAIARLAAARVATAGLELGPLLHEAGLTASQIQDRQARVLRLVGLGLLAWLLQLRSRS